MKKLSDLQFAAGCRSSNQASFTMVTGKPRVGLKSRGWLTPAQSNYRLDGSHQRYRTLSEAFGRTLGWMRSGFTILTAIFFGVRKVWRWLIHYASAQTNCHGLHYEFLRNNALDAETFSMGKDLTFRRNHSRRRRWPIRK